MRSVPPAPPKAIQVYRWPALGARSPASMRPRRDRSRRPRTRPSRSSAARLWVIHAGANAGCAARGCRSSSSWLRSPGWPQGTARQSRPTTARSTSQTTSGARWRTFWQSTGTVPGADAGGADHTLPLGRHGPLLRGAPRLRRARPERAVGGGPGAPPARNIRCRLGLAATQLGRDAWAWALTPRAADGTHPRGGMRGDRHRPGSKANPEPALRPCER